MSGIEAVTGFHIPSANDCGSDGNGDIFADTKGYQSVDPATRPEITATDESAKYAGNVAAWSDTNAYGSNEQAFEVARNYLFINKAGTNTIAGEDLTKKLYMQKGAGFNLYGLA